MTEAHVLAVNDYIRARECVTYRGLLGRAPTWPEWLPVDAGELEVAALRADATRAWQEAHPAAEAWQEPTGAPAPGWGWVCYEHDVEALLDALDARIEEAAATVACNAIRNLLNGVRP